MKYFIDLEATQFNQEIISIGCVREDGEKFYSLIKPRKMRTVTNFITELTGITKEMLEKERNSDVVFHNFFDWVSQDGGTVEFFCYGQSDDDFLKKNLRDRTTCFKAQAILTLIIHNLRDYSVDVKNHFGLYTHIALKKVMDYYYPNDEHVCHNALSDAEMLYYVYLGVEGEKEIEGTPFPDYIKRPQPTNSAIVKNECFSNCKIDRFYHGKLEETYDSFADACSYIVKRVKKQGNANCNEENVQKRLKRAINRGEEYFGYLWSLKAEHNEKQEGEK
jgi:DNA polymerase III epsilon subunit-like protein